MDWKEKIAIQLFQGNQEFLSYLPHACQAQENDEWLKKKMKASEYAISETIKFMNNFTIQMNPQCEDSDVSEDMDLGACDNDIYGRNNATSINKKITELSVSEDNICLFLNQLQYTIVFDMGFKVTGSRSEYKKQ